MRRRITALSHGITKKTPKRLLKVTANGKVTAWLLVEVTVKVVEGQGVTLSWLLVTFIF